MARTQVPVTVLTPNSAIADVAGTAIDATNSHYIDPGVYTLEELVIRVTNTTASTKAALVKAGVNPPADEAGAGDLSVSLTAGNSTPTTKFCGPLTSARFIQAPGGAVNVDIPAGMTGTIAVFAIPRTA